MKQKSIYILFFNHNIPATQTAEQPVAKEVLIKTRNMALTHNKTLSGSSYQYTETEYQWPALPLDSWLETCKALQLWMQMAGKIKLALMPPVNHWWHITLLTTPQGLSTGIIPYGAEFFQLDFDFIAHKLILSTSKGAEKYIDLRSRSVSDFYYELMENLRALNIDVHIWTVPVELEERIPFEKDFRIREYNAEAVSVFHRILMEADKVMRIFRAPFTGKASPVHFFWGACDLAVTFFSGRKAPVHSGVPNVGRQVMVEAYSHELCSAGFWPGMGLGEPAFYAYAYPEPVGYKDAKGFPEGAYYNETFGEFILPYEKVIKSGSPQETILAFFKSAFVAGARLNQWEPDLICY